MTDLLSRHELRSPPSVTSGRRDLALLAVAVVAIALRCYVLVRTGGLFGIAEYDDGVHYGAAALLLHGVAPYRAQVFLQPPGVAVLLTPFALLGQLLGNPVGLAAARLATCLVGGLMTWHVGRLATDRWGRAAGLAASGVAATAACSLLAESTVMLEPFVALLTVLALRLLSGVDRPAGGAGDDVVRAAVAGALLGGATTVKAWGLVSLVVIAGWLFVVRRSLVRPLLLGSLAAAAAICAPFLVLAPRAMVHQVVVTQLTRPLDGIGPVASRLADMAGVRTLLRGHPDAVVAGAAALGGLLVVVAVRALHRDRFAWLPAALLGAGTLLFTLAPVFFTHYGDYLVPFVALLAGAAVRVARDRGTWRRLVPVTALLLAVAAVQVSSAVQRTRPSTVDLSALRAALPRTGCVLTETPTLAELAGTLTRPHCAVWLDPRGSALAGPGPSAMRDFYPGGFRQLAGWQLRWQRWAARATAAVVIGDPCGHADWTARTCRVIESRFPEATVVGWHSGQPRMPIEVWSRR